MIDPSNQPTTYSYDPVGNLSSVQHADGTTRVYHYENSAFPHHLTGITAENGPRYSTYSYDSLGRAVTSEHAGGTQKVTLAYSDTSTTVTDGLSGTTTYTMLLDSSQFGRRILGRTRNGLTHTYQLEPTQFRVSQVTDPRGIVTRFTHGSLHPTEITQAYGTPRERTTTTTWHSTLPLILQIDEPGKRTTFTHDANGNVLTKTILDTATSESRTWTYTYNSFGQVLTTDGPRTDISDVTTYTYYNC